MEYCSPQVHKAALSEEDDVTPRSHSKAINLRFDVNYLLGIGFQPGNINLDVKMTNAIISC